jgi:sterol desaturase/sphingolipid hydroxylase (fatty acid hydroxylase superfamily)
MGAAKRVCRLEIFFLVRTRRGTPNFLSWVREKGASHQTSLLSLALEAVFFCMRTFARECQYYGNNRRRSRAISFWCVIFVCIFFLDFIYVLCFNHQKTHFCTHFFYFTWENSPSCAKKAKELQPNTNVQMVFLHLTSTPWCLIIF